MPSKFYDTVALQVELGYIAETLKLRIKWTPYTIKEHGSSADYGFVGRLFSILPKGEDDSYVVPLHTRFKMFAKKAASVIQREVESIPGTKVNVMRGGLAYLPTTSKDEIAENIESGIKQHVSALVDRNMEFGFILTVPFEVSLDEAQTISPFTRVQAACEAIKQEAQKAGIEFRFNVQVTDEPAERGNVILAAFFAVDEAKDSIAPPKVRAKVVARSIASNFKRFVKEGTWFSFASNDDYTGPKTLKSEDDIRVAMEYSLGRAVVQQIFTPFFLRGDVHSESI